MDITISSPEEIKPVESEIKERFTKVIAPYIERLAQKGVTLKPTFYYVTITRHKIPLKDWMKLSFLRHMPVFIRQKFVHLYVKYDQNLYTGPTRKADNKLSKNMKTGSREYTVSFRLHPSAMSATKAQHKHRYKEIAFPAAKIQKHPNGYRIVSEDVETDRVIKYLERMEKKLQNKEPEKVCTEGITDFFRYSCSARYTSHPGYDRIDRRSVPLLIFLGVYIILSLILIFISD